MKVLHFCSYFEGSKVYGNLFSRLASLGVDNSIYIPVRRNCEATLTSSDPGDKYTVGCLSFFTRVFYSFKVFKVLLFFPYNIGGVKDSNIIHAHTLYSDGIPAYVYSKIKGLPLVITIRGTDVTLGFKYYLHYKLLAKLALGYSKKIIFVSPSHKLKFQRYFGNGYDRKLEVIPNGVDDFFINNAVKKKKPNDHVSAVYVGAINRNKNVGLSILAFFSRAKNNSSFHVVGGTFDEYVSVFGDLPIELRRKVIFHGKLEKEKVIDLMKVSSIFIMNSHSETFGLVYVEAISQCLPIVYTSGQGVDGYFDDGQYGFKADSHSVESISMAIRDTLNKFPDGLGPFEHNPAIDFSWDKIAKVYKEVVYK